MNLAGRYAAWVRRRAGLIVLACALVTAGAVALAARLSISTDLSALLPRGYASVEDLHRLLARIGGSASLTVAVESPELAASQRFADDLVRALERELGGEIAHIDYKVDAVRRYYERHAAVYLDKDALEKIERDLDEATRRAKLDASPLPYELGLDDGPVGTEGEGGAEERVDAIARRLDDAEQALKRFPDGYYAGEGGRLLAIFVRPRSSGSDPEVARAFISKVDRIIASLDPSSYHPQLRTAYTGAYQISLDEQAAIVRDLVSTAALCIGLIALSVILYFRRFRILLLLGVTLACACACAFGLAWLSVGFLNIQTAFLGSIIAGTGINYGIILLARYLEERRGGAAEAQALQVALGSTFVATFTASATTAISFGTLLIARISSFRHFAIIGGGGILFCWVLSFTLLPALLVLSERISPTVRASQPSPRWPELFASLPVLHPRAIALGALGLAVLSAVAFARFLPDILETDGRNLRNRSSAESGAAKLDERVAHIRGGSMTPGFVVTETRQEARRVCEVLNERVRREGEARAPLHRCTSIYSLLPSEQEDKLRLARRIVQKLDELPEEALSDKGRARIRELRGRIVLDPVTLESLPEELLRPFREVSGALGRLVAVDPPKGRDLWIAENLFAFTDAIRRIDLGGGRVITSSGDAVIFADILREIAHDAPRTTALALGGVILFVLIALRGGRGTVHVVVALVLGVLWMVGIAAALRVKLNFFNFVALPTTFGIGVDYAINVYARYRQGSGPDRARRVHEALRSTGGAVFLCSTTTIIGYATLIIADNLALVSFGKLAIVGELTCVAASLLLLPATVLLDRRG